MRQALTIRSSVLEGYAALAREAGLDPAHMAKAVGLTPKVISSPDSVIPARKVYRLLELSAAQSKLDDFGLRLSQRRGLSHLGVLGLQVRDEADVRSALRRIVAKLDLHSTCTHLSVDEHGETAVLTLTLLADGEPTFRQGTELAVAQLFRDLVALIGPGWRPLGVQFIHAAGRSPRAVRALFDCPVHFAGERNAIIVRSADLDRPVHGADAGFKTYADALASGRSSLADRISVDSTRQAVAHLLSRGRCTSYAVAERLGVDRRTLHRRLATAGTSFSQILDDLRFELTKQYLDAGRLSMTEIAGLVGFNSSGSLSRWFSRCCGCSPTSWRLDANRDEPESSNERPSRQVRSSESRREAQTAAAAQRKSRRHR
jgi:AraC-like DNA-binding protein